MRFVDLITDRKFVLVVSLPSNNLELAKAAHFMDFSALMPRSFAARKYPVKVSPAPVVSTAATSRAGTQICSS